MKRVFFARVSPTAFARASELGAVFLSLFPARAFACAVCGGGNPANRFAFFMMTVVMSVLPIGLFVVAFLWLRARLLARNDSEFVERDTVPDAPRPTLVDTTSRDTGEPHPPPVPAA
jgi:hypothetical protein